ncbi:hypothetical protein HDU87_003982 [Geranomyces variabilis]|uniref:PB1 domain-containing protein n=1 Tax=Geranomyces variabilis TaxID=109894 RepID=A0AAD5TVN2_9FUNG|nr:hypothetical protein HDU87_003982 [Geranomyces variabilis]
MIGDASLAYAWPTPSPLQASLTDLTSLAVKISLDGTVRRFSLASIDHTELHATVRTLYGLAGEDELSLSWMDEEGDECRLDHETELAEAARCARRHGTGLLKLHGHTVERTQSSDLFRDDISESSDSDDEEQQHPGLPGAFYTAIPPHNALIREIEESEMEEGLLPALFTDGWSKSVACQHDAAARPMGVQATTTTRDQSIQVNLITPSGASLANTITTRTVSTETPCTPSVTTVGTDMHVSTAHMGTQMHVATTHMHMGTQFDRATTSATQDKETQHFAAASTIAVDVRCGPDAHRKTVGFSHSIKIPSIVEEEDELIPNSPYPRDESDEESEELLSNEEDEEKKEEEQFAANVTSPGEFVMV